MSCVSEGRSEENGSAPIFCKAQGYCPLLEKVTLHRLPAKQNFFRKSSSW